MNIVKSRLCNKIEDNFLMVSLIVYIEKEIATKFSIDSIIDDFRDLENTSSSIRIKEWVKMFFFRRIHNGLLLVNMY